MEVIIGSTRIWFENYTPKVIIRSLITFGEWAIQKAKGLQCEEILS